MDLNARIPKRPKAPKLGGLTHLERLLGLRNDGVLTTDAVLISMDLEVASDRHTLQSSTERPVIEQIAFARLDTRELRFVGPSNNLRSLIDVRMSDVKPSPASKRSARAKARRECVFAQARPITQEQVSETIVENLRIQDHSSASDEGGLRNIVLVGHSIGGDILVLRCLGIDISTAAPILTTIDTHTISRHIFLSRPPSCSPEAEKSFSLTGVVDRGASRVWFQAKAVGISQCR